MTWHPGEGLLNQRQIVVASHQLTADRRTVRLRIAIRRFLVNEVQADAKDVRIWWRTDESSTDGELEAEGEEAEIGGHEEEFVVLCSGDQSVSLRFSASVAHLLLVESNCQ